jgi:hypothetical protein
MTEADKAVYWTAERQSIKDFLQKNAPPLADLYEGAVIMLSEGTIPGRERFICHAAREICNRLSDYLLKDESSSMPDGYDKKKKDKRRIEYSHEIDEIAKNWAIPFSLTSIEPIEGIPIPRRTFEQIDSLIKRHKEVSQRQKEKAFRLFEYFSKGDPSLRSILHPVIRQWMDMARWVQRTAHDAGDIDNLPDFQDVRIHFELLETSLASLVSPFYHIAGGLDDILEDTNN